jgi:CheY-like chemotaxis protein
MPVMSGLEALQMLSRLNQLPPTIILTTFDDDQLVLAGLKAGAKGYLLKDVTLDQLVGAIRTVADGGSLVQPAVTQRLLSGLEHMRNEFVSLDRPDPLTDRETEILRLMARRSPIHWVWPRAPSRTTCPTSSPSWACAIAPGPCSRLSNCSWSEPGGPAEAIVQPPVPTYFPNFVKPLRRKRCGGVFGPDGRIRQRNIVHPLRADTRDALSFRSLSMQNRCRHGNRCANPDQQHRRSLLGLALRFNQPGRGIGPGDS